MAQFVSIPTQVVGQPNILFNSDNITSVVPPSVDTVTLAAGAGSTTTITVTSTTGLVAGMVVVVTAGTGAFAVNTTVVSVNVNGTTFVVSAAPTVTLSGATISAATPYCTLWMQSKAFRLSLGGLTAVNQNTNAIAAANIINNAVTSGNPAPICSPVIFPTVSLSAGAGATAQTTITVASTTGLSVGMVVTVVSGQGVFALNTVISSITNATQFVVSAAPTTTLAGAGISAAVLTVTNIAVV